MVKSRTTRKRIGWATYETVGKNILIFIFIIVEIKTEIEIETKIKIEKIPLYCNGYIKRVRANQ